MSDSPAPALIPTPIPPSSGLMAPPDRDRLGSDRGAMGRAIDETHRKLTPSPENPDTFSGLLARFDTYLAQLQKAENALEGHADKLVAVDPSGPMVNPIGTQTIGDDSSKSVIQRLQARIDRMSSLVARLGKHQERADRAF